MFSEIRDKAGSAFLVFRQSVKSFVNNNNSSVAASLAYYALFAIIPLLLLLFYFLSFFITSSKAIMGRITLLISQFIPYYSDTILKEVYSLAKHKGIWEIVSVGALIWASTPLIGTLRTAFFDIFRVEERPSYLKTKLLDISVILLTLMLLVAVSFFNITVKKFFSLHISMIPYDVVSYCLTAIIMIVFYLAFSPVRVPLPYILAGSVAATFLWSIIRPVFGFLLTYNPQYGLAFGSLKALFIIVIWIYYSFCVLLFGAEIIANLRRKDILMLKGLFYDKSSGGHTAKLARSFGRTFNAGAVIFRENDAGNEMFYVISGSVSLTKKEQVVSVLREGDYFGEMALLLGTARTATAVAGEDNAVVIAVTPENFETILKEDPKIAIIFLKELAQRLKTADEFLQ